MRQLLMVAFLALATLMIVPAPAAALPPLPCVTAPVGVIVLGDVIITPGQHLVGCQGTNTLVRCHNTIGYVYVWPGTRETICTPYLP